MSISIKLPDGSTKDLEDGANGYDLAKAIGSRLAKVVIGCRVNGELWDFHRPLPDGAEVKLVKQDEKDGLEILRHSSAHVLAGALKRLYGEKNIKLAIGPPIEDGFYYDIESTERISDEDLPGIEKEINKILQENYPFKRTYMSHADAMKKLKDAGEVYKVEMLETTIKDDEVSFYEDGEFNDLCEGPHVPSTGRIGAIRLQKVTGAYWRGDEKNKMLTRIYGTAFSTEKELNEHMKWLDEAKKRDHRKIGKEMDLFSIHSDVGGGLVHWHPKGTILRDVVEDRWKKMHRERGYQLVTTPHVASERLYEISGHLENFQQSMFGSMDVEGRPFRVKPMNCPGHIMIYKTKLHSYKELPIRLAELGMCYRFEKAGVLHGLLRVRGFTIDDSHIFVTPDRVEEEIVEVFKFAMEYLKSFGFEDFKIYLSTKPPDKSVGSDEDWKMAEEALANALKTAGAEFEVDPGGGAFYGPKIDIKVKDSLKRLWQCGTVQFDFNLPERFDLTYVAEDSSKKRPYMVHRALLGSVERFLGVLIEHYGGDFPLQLAPEQIRVIPITDKENEYGQKLIERLRKDGFRSEIDLANAPLKRKIRDATLQKIPYLAVVGKREAADDQVAVRARKGEKQEVMSVEDFIGKLKQEVDYATS